MAGTPALLPLLRRWLFTSLPVLVLLALVACGGGGDAGTGRAAGAGAAPELARASIDELQLLAHTPRACAAEADCPGGSHCDAAAGRCAWSCYADSDCGDVRTCDLRGRCVAPAAPPRTSPASTSGLRTSSVSAQLSAEHATCQALPLQEKLDVLEGLDENPAACFDDLDCPCGAYCANDATCRYDCVFDSATTAPFCAPGDVCSPDGRCVLPSGGDDPSVIADLEVTPDLIQGNTAAAAVIVPVDVRIRARLPGHIAQAAANVTVRLEVAEHAGGPTALLPRVRCAAGEPFAATCQLAPGWTFGADPDAQRSSPRQISIEIPQGTTPDDWSVVVRSEWSDTPVSVTVLARPVVAPPAETGHFTGTLSWAQPAGDPLVLPVEAEVTANRVMLIEPSRLLLPSGQAVLSKAAADLTYYAWLQSDHAFSGPQQALAVLDVDSWTFTPATQRITSNLRLTLGNGPAPAQLSLALDYAGPTTNATCTAATCGAGKYCNTEIGLCMPGTRSYSTIQADGTVAPSTLLFAAARAEWTAATNGLRAFTDLFGGDDVIGMERAMCFKGPVQSTAGFLSSSNANPLPIDDAVNPALETGCSAPGSPPGHTSAAQSVFPFANRTTAVTVNGANSETFNLLDTCLEELAVVPPQAPPFTLEGLMQPRQCVSVARYMLATSAPTSTTTNYPQVARRRLQNQLTRQWVTLHAMIARGAVQEGEYDEAVGGTLDQPMSIKLGQVVDVIEKGWRLVARAKRTDPADAQAAQRPDYRDLGRPVTHWTFNQASPINGLVADTEGKNPLRITNNVNTAQNFLSLGQSTTMTCRTDNDVALPDRHFSLVAWLGVANTLNSYALFEKTSAFDIFRIRVYNSSTATRRIEIGHYAILALGVTRLTGSATFDVPAEAGYYAFVEDGGDFRVYQILRHPDTGVPIANSFSPMSTLTGGPRWGSPGKVSIGCQVAQQGIALVDEVSLWDRPLAKETVKAFGATYIPPTGGTIPAVDSLAPRQLALGASDEPAQGLAVSLVDGLAAHMELLSAYVRAERDAMFLECGASSVGPARTRVLDRVGRGLRFATVIENDARDLVVLAATSATPWLPRYNAALRLLAGKRAEVVQQLDLATRCGNPLGIADDDLPLYHGTEVGESARFFASSRFLIAQARQQVDASSAELLLARNAWQQQRISAFQNAVLAPAEKQERLRKIEQEYEGALRRLCGAPATGTVLAAFRAGTMTTTNCFLKRELPGCGGAEGMSIKTVPAQCLRGEIGEQVLQIQGAEIDLRNAENAYERAIGLYDSEMEYCTRREDFHEETHAIQEAHRAHMIKLREARQSSGLFGGFVKAMVGMAVGALAGQPTIAIGSWLDAVGMVAGQPEQQAADNEQDAESAHQLVMAARNQALDLMACFHGADNQKFAIDAARDIIDRSYLDTKSAVLRLENQQAEIRALVNQAIGDLDFEAQMVRVLPHHHYWLDDHIDAYRRHFRYAQRLTYLALRAFEYESQQSLGFGDELLAARLPAVLDEVLLVLEQRTSPMQGEQGYVVGEFNPVMSLRDEILRLGTGEAPPGFPQLDSMAALRAYLASDASKIYSNGQYVGHGIRFALKPQPWAQFSCAERIWRITAALQVEGSPLNNVQLLLWQENSFASQRCRAAERGELHVARIRPEHNLLVGEGGNFDGSAFVRPLRYTAMTVTGLGNKSREELQSMPEGLHSGFAGRGLYANYVLLFPSLQFPDAVLATVKDVLLRFDIVEVTDISGDPNP